MRCSTPVWLELSGHSNGASLTSGRLDYLVAALRISFELCYLPKQARCASML
jgi:hypothetical protein